MALNMVPEHDISASSGCAAKTNMSNFMGAKIRRVVGIE
jgi:hypothetical protein